MEINQMKLDMLGIITDQFEAMKAFYAETLELEIAIELPKYVEFKTSGIRLAISTNEVMMQATGHPSYKQKKQGQSLELAFRVEKINEVDTTYEQLLARGAASIHAPADMPWGQRTAFFADPDGNIHEIFCDISE